VVLLLIVGVVAINTFGGNKNKDKKVDEKTTPSKEIAETKKAAKTTTSTTPTTTLETQENITEAFVVYYDQTASWQSGNTSMYGLNLGLLNNSSSSVSDWNIELTIPGVSEVAGWEADFSINGDVLTIKNGNNNGNLGDNAMGFFGCNLGVVGGLNITDAKVNGVSAKVLAQSVNQNDWKGNQAASNGNNGNNNNNNNNNANVTVDKSELLKRSEVAKSGDDWLHTDGKYIYDKDNKKVWITGASWFGYNTGTNTFDGLWNSELKSTVEAIADHGLNLIRVPISAQLLNQWASGEYPKANYNNAYNTDLNSLNSLEIFDYFLVLCEKNGIKVMVDIHCAKTDAQGHNVNLWYTDEISVDDYYDALLWVADRYKENDTILAIDLKNEPHGKESEGDNAAIWNASTASNNWKNVAETAAKRVLSKNPNLLVVIEGIEIYPKDIKKNGDFKSTDKNDYYYNWWGGNLRGVKDYPIELGKYQDKVVYSPHDYGPTVYAQPWFEGDFNYDSLMKDCWHDNWFYIYEEDIAPLLIGEWGGFMKEPNLKWMTCMRELIGKYKLNHTFWCINANSGDTGGLLLDDFTTWDEEKYNFVKEVLWQENGKFVGLDHEIPLGKNGISISEVK